jgi:hypothetical protein
MSSIIVAALLTTVAVKASTGFSTGELLYEDCGQSRQFVVGYVTGWLDKWNRDDYLARRTLQDAMPSAKAMVNSAFLAESVGVNFCLPVGTSAATVSEELCKFLGQNPDARPATGDDLMMTILQVRFRCAAP